MKSNNLVALKLSTRFTVIVSFVILIILITFLTILRVAFNLRQHNSLYHASQEIYNSITEEINLDSLNIPYFISAVVYDANTKEIFFTNDPFLPLLDNTEGKVKKYYAKGFYTDGDLSIIYHVESLNHSGATLNIETAIDTDRQTARTFINYFPRATVLMFPLILISFLLSLLITKRTLKPVKEITKAAQDMSSTNLETLLPVSKENNELDQLASTFNLLFENLRKDFEQERNFTSNVSHELKTPVAGILGQANLLKRWGKDDPEQLEKSLDLIINEANSMNYIITNLLQISKLEKGNEKIFEETLNLLTLFNRIKAEFLAIEPSVQFDFDESQSVTIKTDIEFLHQVLTAIVSNSLKFHKAAINKNSIENSNCVISFVINQLDGKTKIDVIDNGPGFPEEVLPHVFERFYRGDSAHSRSAGGAGLGLSISDSIIKFLGGKLSASNREDGTHGAVISIELFS